MAFLGRLLRDGNLSLLPVSRAHVYLTHPFVPSGALLETMAAGCGAPASEAGPVAGVVPDMANDRLADFLGRMCLADIIEELLAEPEQRKRPGKSARATAVDRCDSRSRFPSPLQQMLGDRIAFR